MLNYLIPKITRIITIITKIPKNVSLTENIVLNNYSFEHTPRESSAGGASIYS